MPREPSFHLLQEKLRDRSNIEIAGTDLATGDGYRVTIRCAEIDFEAFSNVAPTTLEQAVAETLPISIGATTYVIESTFGPTFLQAVKDSARLDAVSITVQSRRQIVTIIGRDVLRLSSLLESQVPVSVQWEPETLVEVSREWGRKVGHAAKDLAGIREVTLGLDHLETLERSGQSEAYEAVRKEAIWPAPDIEQLRQRGCVPEVAFGIVSCWRMLSHRPANNPAARLLYVRELEAFRAELDQCHTLEDFQQAIGKLIAALGTRPASIVGPRLPKFALRLNSRLRDFLVNSDTVLRDLLRIANSGESKKWSIVDDSLSHEPVTRQPAGLPMPERQRMRFDQLRRSGPNLPPVPALTDVSHALGVTGLELGNYVSKREGQVLVRLLAESLTDLRYLLGDWVVTLCRRGNLSVALGARGKGKACAHYEPALRVVNLTKSHGDGSLAHEFAHFLDHMLAIHAPEGESRYLSARVTSPQANTDPIAVAMARVMQTVKFVTHRERVAGEVKPPRWYLKRWIDSRGYDPLLPPQQSFDRVADREPDVFRRGRNCKANSISLVHSIAKFSKAPVDVEIAVDEQTDFLNQAVTLGAYWKRPEELFARAFESYVEDQLTERGQCSQYLVFGTQQDWTTCRGLPYPVGEERRRIAEAIRDLVSAITAD